MTSKERVAAIYGAFGRGNVSEILEHLSPDVEWEYGIASTDVPWLAPRRGRDGAAKFFAVVAELVEIRRFDLKAVIGEGDIVVALFDVEGVVKATGRRFEEIDEVHVWRFGAEGRVVRFRHRVDTHAQHLAYRGG